MDTSFSYDSPSWTAFEFDTRAERDAFVSKHDKTERITKRSMLKIVGTTQYKIDNRIEKLIYDHHYYDDARDVLAMPC